MTNGMGRDWLKLDMRQMPVCGPMKVFGVRGDKGKVIYTYEIINVANVFKGAKGDRAPMCFVAEKTKAGSALIRRIR